MADLGELAGEYRVAGIDGAEFNEVFGIGVSIAGSTMSFPPACAGFVWQVELQKGVLFTRRVGMDPTEPGKPPAPVCAVAVHPKQRQLAEALDAATSARRLPSNGILLSGGGRSALLFSQ